MPGSVLVPPSEAGLGTSVVAVVVVPVVAVVVFVVFVVVVIVPVIVVVANDHPEDLTSCKWSSGESNILQIIIQRIWPLANDICRDWPLTNDHLSPPSP